MGSVEESKPLGDSIMFSPLKVGVLDLAHRVVQCPLTRMRGTKVEEGVWEPSDLALEYYTQRATKGGFQITEATPITRLGAGYGGVPGIFTPGQIARWKLITDAVHAKGGFIYSQLWHVGRATVPSMLDGKLAWACSDIPIRGRDDNAFDGTKYEHHKQHVMTEADIKVLIEQYVTAAKAALEAGFDGVEIHNANGYLLDQFLNDNVNTRTDSYGGSIENRSRLTLEVIRAITSAVGAERTGIRLSPYNYYLDTHDSDPNTHWAYLCERISELPKENRVAYVHMVEPRFDEQLTEAQKLASLTSTQLPKGKLASSKEAHSLVPFASILKRAGIKFIAAGNFNASNALPKLEAGDADLIAYGRYFISNPDLPKRLQMGWPLAKYDRSTFYGASPPEKGYTDYPAFEKGV